MQFYPSRLGSRTMQVLCTLFCSLFLAALASAADAKKSFSIDAGPAETTLKAFAQQSGNGVLFDPAKVKGIQTNEVKGELETDVAMDRLLSGTKLSAIPDKASGAFSIRREATVETAEKNASSRPSNGRAAEVTEGGAIKLDTFEVMGTKLLNMDKPRSVDDPQPYMVFNRETIERSGASNLEDFLKQRLTMNSQGQTFSQNVSPRGNISQINLRGLGANQTLILVDGHRTASVGSVGAVFQSDLNGIPLGAIERIEVLPTTASGIYGGSATGGVVNVILRRDYAGVDIKVSYENTFDSDVAIRRLDFNAGFNLEGGKTNILLGGSASEQGLLQVQDRSLFASGRAAILANNPAAILNVTNPPLGATPNFKSSNGSPLFGPGTANFGSVPVGYSGGSGLSGLSGNAGKYNLNLADTSQLLGGGRAGLLNGPIVYTAMATIRRQFTPALQAFVELSASNNSGRFSYNSLSGSYTIPATAPNNPFGQNIRVTSPISASDITLRSSNFDRRIVSGLLFKLPNEWQAETDYTWNRVRNDYFAESLSNGGEVAAISNGTIDLLRDPSVSPFNFSGFINPQRQTTPFISLLRDATVRAAGPVASISGGNISASALVEYRDEALSDGYQFNSDAARNTLYFPSRSQAITSAYLELNLPIISERNQMRGVSAFDIQASGRWDSYVVQGSTGSVTVGSTTPVIRNRVELDSANPTFGVRYAPVKDFTLRASYGTGFLPPSVSQLVPQAPLTAAGFATDPKRGNQAIGSAQFLAGGSPNLIPEKSKSWSAGVIFTPKVIDGLRVSLDYSRIDKTNNIVTLTPQQVVDNEALLPGRVTRGPVPAGDPFGVGPITAVDTSLLNLARAKVEAYDIAVDYTSSRSRVVTADVFVRGTWQTHYQTQVISTAPLIENVGVTNSNPLKFKANAGVIFKLRSVSLGWSVRYFDSYLVSTSAATILSQGSPRVPSQIYHDLFLGYRFAAASHIREADRHHTWLANTEIQVGVKNVFNAKPPFDAGNAGFYYSWFGDPRGASYYISVKRSF